jgi:hypothetical protein
MRKVRALAIGAAVLASGCTAGAWRDRAHDRADSRSPPEPAGLAVSARATEVAQAGFGWSRAESLGLIDGRFTAASERRSEFGVSLLHVYEYRREGRELLAIRHAGFSDPGYDPYPFSWPLDADRSALDGGFDVHLAIVAGMTFRIDELWISWRAASALTRSDDAYGRLPEEIRRRAPPIRRRDRASTPAAARRRTATRSSASGATPIAARDRGGLERVSGAERGASRPRPSPDPAHAQVGEDARQEGGLFGRQTASSRRAS